MNIYQILIALSRIKPVFHSEADFKHALAWQIQITYPDINIRLEFPFAALDRLIHLDIWCNAMKQFFALELKYKTKFLRTCYQNEPFNLTSQGAQDQARYDFIKDITRLEIIKERRSDVEAYAIFLTNDSLYWNSAPGEDTVDAEFRLDDENPRSLNGTLRWSPVASPGTTNGREAPLILNGNYPIGWRDYSRLEGGRNSLFRFLLVAI